MKINDIEIPKTSIFYNCKQLQFEEVKVLYKDGNLCDVKLVRCGDKQYALKIIKKDRILQQDYVFQYKRIINEINILYRINHPNIISLYWHREDEKTVKLLFQYFGVKLTKFIKKKELNENQLKQIIRGVCSALNKMHSLGFIHRDISSSNILVEQNLQCKLIDFGYANEMIGRRQTYLGVLDYMAPEIVKKQPYNTKVDIWSLGIVIYELFNRKNPFYQEEKGKSSQKISDEINKNRDNLSYQFVSTCPLKVKNLIKSMLIVNPEKRPDIVEVMNNVWFTDIENKQNNEEVKNRKTYKIINNTSLVDTKQMSIKELQDTLFDLVRNHSRQIIRKKQLIEQYLKTEQKLIKLRNEQMIKSWK